jgi:hypothetical protein
MSTLPERNFPLGCLKFLSVILQPLTITYQHKCSLAIGERKFALQNTCLKNVVFCFHTGCSHEMDIDGRRAPSFYENKPAYWNGLHNALYQRARVKSWNQFTLVTSRWGCMLWRDREWKVGNKLLLSFEHSASFVKPDWPRWVWHLLRLLTTCLYSLTHDDNAEMHAHRGV